MQKHQSLYVTYKINAKWTADLNVNPKTIIFTEENTGKNLCNSGTQRFLRTWKVCIKEKNETHFIKLETAAWKTLFTEWKDKPQTSRKYLQIICLMKELYPKYPQNSYNSIIKQATQFK